MRSPAEIRQVLEAHFPEIENPGPPEGPIPAVTAERQAALAGAVYDLAVLMDSGTPTPIEAGS